METIGTTNESRSMHLHSPWGKLDCENESRSMHFHSPICPMDCNRRSCSGCRFCNKVNVPESERRQVDTKHEAKDRKKRIRIVDSLYYNTQSGIRSDTDF